MWWLFYQLLSIVCWCIACLSSVLCQLISAVGKMKLKCWSRVCHIHTYIFCLFQLAVQCGSAWELTLLNPWQQCIHIRGVCDCPSGTQFTLKLYQFYLWFGSLNRSVASEHTAVISHWWTNCDWSSMDCPLSHVGLVVNLNVGTIGWIWFLIAFRYSVRVG